MRESGRAYFGGYIEGDLAVNDFADYENASGNVAVSLKHPLSLHIQRLSQIRMAVPALRKGQYSTANINASGIAFKRRYVDANTDSYALVAISGSATFSNILNGTYTDVVSGDVKQVSNNTLSATLNGKGNIRVYVLSTSKTPAPGKVGKDGKYIYASSPVNIEQGAYPDETEPLLEEVPTPVDPGEVTEPVLLHGEQAIFFEKPANWGSLINSYIYYEDNGAKMITKAWPGDRMQSLGGGVYKFVLEGSINNWKVLFNDGGGNQAPASIGFDVVNGGYYKAGGLDHTLNETLPTGAAEPELLSTIRFYSSNGVLYAESGITRELSLYSISGVVVCHLKINVGKNSYEGIPKGIYIADRQKIIIH